MSLIKSSEAPSAMVRLSLRDIEADARAKLDGASRECAAILAAAREEAASIYDAARAEGFASGQSEGVERGRAEGHIEAMELRSGPLEALIHSLKAAVSEMVLSRKRLEEEVHREAIDLALAIARRVTKRQAEIDPAVLSANLREAFSLIGRSGEMRIAIHPAERKSLDEAMKHLAVEWPAASGAVIVEDQSLSAGDCRVFTQHGRIDAVLDAQLERIAREILPETE